MEEMMMVMMNIRSHENNNNNNLNIPITTTSTCPTWKLYENPFYNSSHQQQITHHSDQYSSNPTRIHTLHLPVPARKIAASFWDLDFINKPTLMMELKAELDRHCKARKKAEGLNKKLARELSEERNGREALERAVQELAREMERMKSEMEEERKMLRTAEVIREERVQMKLADARVVMEEKLSELEIARKAANIDHCNCRDEKVEVEIGNSRLMAVVVEDDRQLLPPQSSTVENPHIRRGIKGFVEFPRVVRAIGCKQRGAVSM